MRRILVLRNCKEDMTSRNGFKYPEKGVVECQDWEATYKCGHGLHGLPWGVGSVSYFYTEENTRWLVISVNPDDGYMAGEVELTDKCKFRKGKVVFCGNRDDAVDYIIRHGGADKPVVYCRKTGGNSATITGGVGSTITGGYKATITGGDWSTLTGGVGSTITGGDRSTLTGGYRSTLTGGNSATLTGGDWSTLTGGDGATITGGNEAILNFKYYDGKRYRIKIAYVGENGIQANVAYKLNDKFEIVEA